MYSLIGIIAAMEISSPQPCSESIGRKLLSSSIVFCSSFTVLSLRLKIKPGNLLVSNESVKPYKQLQEELFRIGTELFLLVYGRFIFRFSHNSDSSEVNGFSLKSLITVSFHLIDIFTHRSFKFFSIKSFFFPRIRGIIFFRISLVHSVATVTAICAPF